MNTMLKLMIISSDWQFEERVKHKILLSNSWVRELECNEPVYVVLNEEVI